MNTQLLTIDLPEPIYRRVKSRSQRMQRTMAEEIVAVITSALPLEDQLAPEIEDELTTLDLFSDDELWRAAQMTIPEKYTERMQSLLDQQQRNGLGASEQEMAEQLARYYDRVMLVRAKAAALLKQRGHDISQLSQLSPTP